MVFLFEIPCLLFGLFCVLLSASHRRRPVLVPPSPSKIPPLEAPIFISAFRLGQHLRRRLAGMWM